MTVTVAAIPPPAALEGAQADAVDPLPQVVEQPLPRIHGFNADFLDGYSNEHFFDAIAAERDARIAADEAEAAARMAADEAEAATREAADERLQAALDREAAERQAGDAGIQADLDAEAAARTAGDAALDSALDVETAARVAGDEDAKAYTDAAIAALAPRVLVKSFHAVGSTGGVDATFATLVPTQSAFVLLSYTVQVFPGDCTSAPRAKVRFTFSDGSSALDEVVAGGCGSMTTRTASPTGSVTRAIISGGGSPTSVELNTLFANAGGKSLVRIDLIRQTTGGLNDVQWQIYALDV